MSVFPYHLNFGLRALDKGNDEEEIPCRAGSPVSESVSEHLNQLTDTELVERLRGNSSPESIAVLFGRYRHLILSICIKILRDPFEAEDVCQDVILAIWSKADEFDPSRGTVQVWIVQLAYSKSLHRRRHLITRHGYGKNGNGNGNGNGHVEALEQSYLPDTDERLTYEKRLSLMIDAFGSLNEKQKKTLQLIYFDGLSIREVAERTNESVENTRHHYYRGLKKLKETLASAPVGKVR